MEIQDLINELERVKGIAGRRLDRIAQLQHDLAVVEDKLEDTRSELKYEKGISAAQRSLAGQLATELAQIEDDPRRLEDFEDDELDASLARIRELDELGREPRSHLENELADARARIADLEALADNRLERIMNLLGAIDAKDFKTIRKDDELAAAVDPEQARVELGREPRSHIDYGL